MQNIGENTLEQSGENSRTTNQHKKHRKAYLLLYLKNISAVATSILWWTSTRNLSKAHVTRDSIGSAIWATSLQRAIK